MAEKTKVFNSSNVPVVIDRAGHILGGGEWAEVDLTDNHVKSAIDLGQLIVPDEPPKPETSSDVDTTDDVSAKSKKGAS